MSMLSSQVDKLRELAEHLDERERGMDEYVTALRDAADTIWQLRDDLQRTNNENARMREQVADACMQLGGAWARCAELRELLQRTWDAFHDATAREFVSVKNELRELGVEVDDGNKT